MRFYTLPNTSQGFRRANIIYAGEVCSREKVHKRLKNVVPVLVLHLGADKRGPLLKLRFLLGVTR